ncbi:MAG: hypothetical protein ACREDM_14395 [Methylocella sp.]
MARRANLQSINACAGLSRRRQVNLKKVNLEIDGMARNVGQCALAMIGSTKKSN